MAGKEYSTDLLQVLVGFVDEINVHVKALATGDIGAINVSNTQNEQCSVSMEKDLEVGETITTVAAGMSS